MECIFGFSFILTHYTSFRWEMQQFCLKNAKEFKIMHYFPLKTTQYAFIHYKYTCSCIFPLRPEISDLILDKELYQSYNTVIETVLYD